MRNVVDDVQSDRNGSLASPRSAQRRIVSASGQAADIVQLSPRIPSWLRASLRCSSRPVSMIRDAPSRRIKAIPLLNRIILSISSHHKDLNDDTGGIPTERMFPNLLILLDVLPRRPKPPPTGSSARAAGPPDRPDEWRPVRRWGSTAGAGSGRDCRRAFPA